MDNKNMEFLALAKRGDVLDQFIEDNASEEVLDEYRNMLEGCIREARMAVIELLVTGDSPADGYTMMKDLIPKMEAIAKKIPGSQDVLQ